MTMLKIEWIDPWWRDCDTQSNLDAYLVKYAEYAEFVEYAKYAEYKDTQDSTHHFISLLNHQETIDEWTQNDKIYDTELSYLGTFTFPTFERRDMAICRQWLPPSCLELREAISGFLRM